MLKNYPINRRQWLGKSACGFGSLAASAMASELQVEARMPLTHHLAKAKRIIFLFMQGGVSQVDSFDYKPLLAKRDGETMMFDDARQLAKQGKPTSQRVMRSPWEFKQYGGSGRWVSQLFPELARHVDDMCMIHSMHTEGVAHGPSTLFLHCGSTNFTRPSFGSWVLYGLGTDNANLPGFVSIAPSIGNGGPRNYGQAFLPARYQGTRVGTADGKPLTIDSLTRDDLPQDRQKELHSLLRELNLHQTKRRAFMDSELEAALESNELAWRMQEVAPEVLNLSSETETTLQMYGIDDPKTRSYGQRCLLARRMCEAGVRFIQVNYGDNSANPAWDQHSDIPKHANHAYAVDKPIAALLTDLKQRGMLDDTIVWWGSEFGRTPYAQENGTGRDHNPGGFTIWLAGGGFKAGYTHGETDELGFRGVSGRVHMHDLHATLLHQMGIDHTKLTFSHAGRNFRLTDVHGRVVKEVIV